jgi:hypothetical protein
MVTSKSIRESRRARRRPSAKAPLAPSDVATPAGSLRRATLSAGVNHSAADLAGSLVTLPRLRGVATIEEKLL